MILIGDGIIPQVENFASKFAYNKLTVDAFITALGIMNEKATEPTGNSYVIICNEKAWSDCQRALGEWLMQHKTNGTYLFSKAANGKVDVGATFNSYEYGGNTISFKVDRTFSREWGSQKGFMMMLDLTSDKVSGEPAILTNIWVAAA